MSKRAAVTWTNAVQVSYSICISKDNNKPASAMKPPECAVLGRVHATVREWGRTLLPDSQERCVFSQGRTRAHACRRSPRGCAPDPPQPDPAAATCTAPSPLHTPRSTPASPHAPPPPTTTSKPSSHLCVENKNCVFPTPFRKRALQTSSSIYITAE